DRDTHGSRLGAQPVREAESVRAVPRRGDPLLLHGPAARRPLLVVMPAGFGIWKGSGDTTAEQQALAAVKVHANTVDALVLSGRAGVGRLAGLAATPSTGDRVAPHVKALPASTRPGKTAKLRFRVGDNSGRSREVVRVYGANFFLYASIVSPMERARGSS